MARVRATDLSGFPEAFAASSQNTKLQYRRSKTHFAVHGRNAPAGATIELKSERIAVYPITRLSDIPGAGRRTPVYTLRSGGRIAVPTGRLFVRLAPEQRFRDHADSFRKAGYEIAETAPYAANAGWVRAATSSIATALAGMHRLADLPAVENVEPQMLAVAARRK